MPKAPQQVYYTLAQAGKYIGVHQNFLRVKMKEKLLTADLFDSCGRPMFSKQTLDKYISSVQHRPLPTQMDGYVPESDVKRVLSKLGGCDIRNSTMLNIAQMGILPCYDIDAYGGYRCYPKEALAALLDFIEAQKKAAIVSTRTAVTADLEELIRQCKDELGLNAAQSEDNAGAVSES